MTDENGSRALHTASFSQVRWYIGRQQREHCKTVGSAYLGSNPPPVIHNRRSEPVTQDCVTGIYMRNKRLRKRRLRSVGHTWARSAPREVRGGLDQMASELRKHQAGYMAGTREDDQRYMALWARRGPGPGVTDAWRTDRGGYRRCGTPLAIVTCGASRRPSAPGRSGPW